MLLLLTVIEDVMTCENTCKLTEVVMGNASFMVFFDRNTILIHNTELMALYFSFCFIQSLRKIFLTPYLMMKL